MQKIDLPLSFTAVLFESVSVELLNRTKNERGILGFLKDVIASRTSAAVRPRYGLLVDHYVYDGHVNCPSKYLIREEPIDEM